MKISIWWTPGKANKTMCVEDHTPPGPWMRYSLPPKEAQGDGVKHYLPVRGGKLVLLWAGLGGDRNSHIDNKICAVSELLRTLSID